MQSVPFNDSLVLHVDFVEHLLVVCVGCLFCGIVVIHVHRAVKFRLAQHRRHLCDVPVDRAVGLILLLPQLRVLRG